MRKNYKDVTYKDLEPYIETYISWDSLEKVLGKQRYERFGKFMSGQTCTDKGAYPCDVENFFREESERFFDL